MALVESQLLSLQNVTISTSALSGSRRDDGEKTTGLELLLKRWVDLSLGTESLGVLLLNALALLLDLVDLSSGLLLASSS